MKTILFILLAGCFALGSCTKNKTVDTANFTVDSLRDFSIDANKTYAYMRLHVTYHAGTKAPVRLSVQGLPKGLSYYFSDSTNTPPYYTTFAIFDSMAELGTYRFYVVADGGINGKFFLPVDIKVEPIPNCSDELMSGALGGSLCVGPNFQDSIVKSPTVPNRIVFTNWANTGAAAFADVQCAYQYIKMPSQTINGAIYQGEGNYSYEADGTKRIRISYDKLQNGISTHCQMFYFL